MLEEDWGVCPESGDLHEDGGDGWFEVLRPQEKQLACGDVRLILAPICYLFLWELPPEPSGFFCLSDGS